MAWRWRRSTLRQAHENGDVEQSHNRFKEAVDQALLLRGSRDFVNRAAYARFLATSWTSAMPGARRGSPRNGPRSAGSLRHGWRVTSEPVRVRSGSTIHVDRNTYSVDSRLIGERVDVRLYAEELEVWFAGRMMERIPRLRGQGKHRINYRHVIDWLVRKPGAFENYRYREDLFPTSRFRMAYDALRETAPSRASREYLAILELAARENEDLVDNALQALLEEERGISAQAVKEWIGCREAARPVTEVSVEATDLSSFDMLFKHKEVWDGFADGSEAAARGMPARASLAHVS